MCPYNLPGTKYHWSPNFDCTQLHGTGSHLDYTQTPLGLDEYSLNHQM